MLLDAEKLWTTESNCQDNVTLAIGQGFETLLTLLRREPRQKPTKEEPGADSSWQTLDPCTVEMFSLNVQLRTWCCVLSWEKGPFHAIHAIPNPDYPFNPVHGCDMLPPVSLFFVVRCPPPGEAAKKNVKQAVNLSYAQSFFLADAESMETVTTFLRPSTAHSNRSSLYFDFCRLR